jgi:hypothetical protein
LNILVNNDLGARKATGRSSANNRDFEGIVSVESINAHITIPSANEQKLATPSGPGAYEICLNLAETLDIASSRRPIQSTLSYARARAADSINARVRLAAQNDRLHEECALLREELRIKDARTAQTPPQRRPHYGPLERMSILELRSRTLASTIRVLANEEESI